MGKLAEGLSSAAANTMALPLLLLAFIIYLLTKKPPLRRPRGNTASGATTERVRHRVFRRGRRRGRWSEAFRRWCSTSPRSRGSTGRWRRSAPTSHASASAASTSFRSPPPRSPARCSGNRTPTSPPGRSPSPPPPSAAGTRTPRSRPLGTSGRRCATCSPRRSSARLGTAGSRTGADEADNLTRYVYTLATASSTSSGTGGASVDVRHVARHYCGSSSAIFTSLRLVFAFCISDYLPWLRCLDASGTEKMVNEANTTMNRLHDTVIDERWRQWNSSRRRELDDFLDVLITIKDDEGNPLLTIEEVKAQSQEMFFAAIDSPSNAVEWALAEMANAPAAMEKAVEEMDRVVGRERLVQESDIPQLTYAKACIREAFRLHPVGPFNVSHVALADTTVAGYRVLKGSHVIRNMSMPNRLCAQPQSVSLLLHVNARFFITDACMLTLSFLSPPTPPLFIFL